jgi:(E)-4-hydroxy-3-methylbut-2-enyl-diphosphate synthase
MDVPVDGAGGLVGECDSMTISRRSTRAVQVGPVTIGGGAPVSVQTMAKASPDDVAGLHAEIRDAADRGAALVRLAVPNRAAIAPFAEVCRSSPVPIVADIHFRAQLALDAIEAGAAKVRLNPGNVKDWDAIEQVVRAAQSRGVALRIGVNSGSIRTRGAADSRQMAQALAEEALSYVERVEAMGFRDIVLSLKASEPGETIAANLAAADACDLPLHLGVTAAGPADQAMLKSAVGVGGLLAQGVGDTIRLSFTGPPGAEVDAGFELLRACGLLRDRAEVISCPTCGRTRVDLCGLVEQVREAVRDVRVPLKVAVMGCEVNGPGEAAEADVGLAAGKEKATIFRGEERLCTVPEHQALDALMTEVHRLADERSAP